MFILFLYDNCFRKLDEIQNSGCAIVHGVPEVDTFLKVAKFNTCLDTCLRDPKMALSYQTGTFFGYYPQVASTVEVFTRCCE